MAAVLAIAAAAAGPVRGQNASPDVTLDFTTNDWGLPTSGNNHGPEDYSNGTYSITLCTPSSGTNTYRLNSGYLLLGRSGAYLELPEFESAVDSIVVVGNSAASANVKQNIYVGETAVSTQTTGATGTNTYVIDEDYRAAGNIYTLKVESAHNTQITYIKVYYVSSGGGSGSETPTPGQNATTYNVTFGGFAEPAVNTTVSVASLPQTINFYPFAVISNGGDFTSASVTSGGEGKVSVNVFWNQMSITISGTFEGTATIHVVCSDSQEYPISCDITVACTLPPTPHTVRLAAGTEEAANWSIASGNASVPGDQVLENVMSGSQVTATYNGTQKVKSVKAVKYVVPPTPLDNTTTAWTAGTYAVPAGGLTYSAAITVSGDVTLVLTEGTTLTLNKGISLASGATLTIQGTGTMNVNGTNESTASTVAGTGTLVLTSGTLTARGGNGGSVGVFNYHSHGGNGGNAINGSVIVSGGTLTARGGNGGSVGEVSYDCSGGNGGVAISGTLTINGGSTSVNNGSNGSIGEDCDDCTAGAGGKAVAGTVTDNR